VTWSIDLPIRDRDEPLDVDAISDLPQALTPGPRREMARDALLHARFSGLTTVGEAHDEIAKLDAAGRRRALDALRWRAGLDSIEDIEVRERLEVANTGARLTASSESPWQVCPADGCGEIPINELGAPIPVDVKRWWCPTHLHLASEGDMAPRPSRLRIMPGGAIVEVDEAPEAREAAAAASRSAQFEAQQADRRLEAEQRAAAQRALDEQFEAETRI